MISVNVKLKEFARRALFNAPSIPLSRLLITMTFY